MRESVLEIVKNYQMHILVMAQEIRGGTDTIIRSCVHEFVGAIGSKGELLASGSKTDVKCYKTV